MVRPRNYNYMQLVLLVVVWLAAVRSSSDEENLSNKCSAQFQKVTACLPFVTAKAPTPTKECCGAVTDIKNTDPACLCYMIQQIHNGTNKSMGVQESRMLQLSSACKLTNASVTQCPRLLHLAPNSPDAAIFLTNTSTATPTTSASPTTSAANNWNKPPQVLDQAAGSILLISLLLLYFIGLFSSY